MINGEHRREGRLIAVTGASRSGKTLWTAQQVAKSRYLLAWDLLGEWSLRYRCQRITTIPQLAAVIKANRPGRYAFFPQGRVEPFGQFCVAAWLWIQKAPEGDLIVEETASVTQPGKAPPEWGTIIRMGLRFGKNIYPLTQRPAESDKTTFGNASVLHVGRAVTPRDRATVAEYLDVPVADVAALQPLQFIERHADGRLIRGRVDPKKRT